MAAAMISALTALGGAPSTNDLLPVVDVSDTTDAASGTTKKLLISELFATPQITGTATITGGTLTTSNPAVSASQTWNAGGVTFAGFSFNITITAAAAGSALFDFQVGGASVVKYLPKASNPSFRVTAVTPNSQFIDLIPRDSAPGGPTINMNGAVTLDGGDSGLLTISGSAARTTKGGYTAYADANGSYSRRTSVTESLTLNTGGTSTVTAGNLAAATSQIRAILIRITTTITTATAFTVKITGGNVWKNLNGGATSLSTLTAGTTYVLLPNAFGDGDNNAATTLTVTTTGTPGAGVLRITTICDTFSPPTS